MRGLVAVYDQKVRTLEGEQWAPVFPLFKGTKRLGTCHKVLVRSTKPHPAVGTVPD